MPQDPQSDQDFLKASPTDQHAYLMANDPDYATAPKPQQAAYLQHIAPAQPNAGLAPPATNKITPDTAPAPATTRAGESFYRGAGGMSNEEGKNFFMHPLDTLGNAAKAQGELGHQAYKELGKGDVVHGLTHGVEYMVPFLGPQMAHSGEQLESGDIAGGVGTMAGMGTGLLAGKAMGEMAPKGIPRMGTGGNPSTLGTLRPNIPAETAARNVTRAINPPPQEWNSHMEATEGEAGNIKDFAAKHNLPLNNQLDWAKAARASADEANGYFREKILNPVAKERVSVAGSGYRGTTAGEGENATIGDINKRIVAINDELRSGYNKAEAGQTRSATDPELKSERQALTNILHKELSARTGIPADDIAALRQRFGRQYSIADQTLAKVNSRQHGISAEKEGANVPTSKSGFMSKGWNWAWGGPEGISNRAFMKALGGTGAIPATPLPEFNVEPTPLAPRTPAWMMKNRLGVPEQGEPVPSVLSREPEVRPWSERPRGPKSVNPGAPFPRNPFWRGSQ